LKPIINQQDHRIAAMQQVIKKLRHDNLIDGNCFMIFDDELPEDQAFYEYPDGRIQVEQLDKINIDTPRVVIRSLSGNEITALKEKHEVFH
jgi:hypothetical protein